MKSTNCINLTGAGTAGQDWWPDHLVSRLFGTEIFQHRYNRAKVSRHFGASHEVSYGQC